MPFFVTRLRDRLAHRRARRAAIAELRGYDDALLADLGIARAEIPAYVDGRLASRARPTRRRSGTVVRLFPHTGGAVRG